MKRNEARARKLLTALIIPVVFLATSARTAQAQAVADFTGAFAPSQWSVGSNPANPLLVTFNGNASVTLSNYAQWGLSGSAIYITPPSAGLVSFDYSYNGPNPAGCPGSYLTNHGVPVLLTNGSQSSQSGHMTFNVTSASTVGFALNGLMQPTSFGCVSTPTTMTSTATLTISNFHFMPTLLIRPFGDSITYGIGSMDLAQIGYCPLYDYAWPYVWCPAAGEEGGGYRAWLTYAALTTQQFYFRTEGAQNGGSNLAQWETATQAHDGYPGFRTDGMATAAAWPSFSDITLVHLGTNDLLQCRTPTDAAKDLFQDVDSLLASNSKTQLFVAEIIPIYSTTTVNHCVIPNGLSLSASVAEYNKRIAELWSSLQPAKQQRVTLVNMEGLLKDSDYVSGGVHPNVAGYQKMACTWLRAIRKMAPDPGNPCSGVMPTSARSKSRAPAKGSPKMNLTTEESERILRGPTAR